MRPSHSIVGTRATLAALDESAADGPYLSWLQDECVTRFLEVRHQLYDRDRLIAYIASENARSDAVLFGIYVEPSAELVGTLRLCDIRTSLRLCNLSLMVGDKMRWGQGLASEAIALACRYAFGALAMHKVMAGCYAPNEGSRKAFLKAGFALEGRSVEERFFEGGWIDILTLGRLNPADTSTGSAQERGSDAQ